MVAGAGITFNRCSSGAPKARRMAALHMYSFMSENVFVSICSVLMQAVIKGAMKSALPRVLPLSF